MIEERTVPRRNLRDYLKIFDHVTGQPLGRVINITFQGIGVFGEQPIPPERTFRLKMTVPGPGRLPRELLFDARCCWCTQERSLYTQTVYDSGFEFTELTPADRARIARLMADCPLESW
ncbi:MAG: PilZ domain-containing protein [candidate division Zixibacteria bacterium]|nr:PilZ domain-containing protein [candidate division Zixibacteria bacterium]